MNANVPIALLTAACLTTTGLALAEPCGLATPADTFVSAQDQRDRRALEKNLFELAFSTDSLSKLAGYVAVADLEEDLSAGEFTVFAPTNDAFGKVDAETAVALLDPDNRDALKGLLTYHVVEGRIAASDIDEGESTVTTLAGTPLKIVKRGDTITVNGNKVVFPDANATNGVAHLIDGVLLPGSDAAAEAQRFAKESAPKSLLQIAAGNDNFETLATAVEAAGFARSLDNGGPYTVFAPTDEAFDAIPDVVAQLTQPRNVESLRGVLRLHILAGKVDARGAVTAGEAKTRSGDELRFEIDDGQLYVVGPANRAKVIKTNIDATNGIVHVVDSVLLPAEKATHASADASADASH